MNSTDTAGGVPSSGEVPSIETDGRITLSEITSSYNEDNRAIDEAVAAKRAELRQLQEEKAERWRQHNADVVELFRGKIIRFEDNGEWPTWQFAVTVRQRASDLPPAGTTGWFQLSGHDIRIPSRGLLELTDHHGVTWVLLAPHFSEDTFVDIFLDPDRRWWLVADPLAATPAAESETQS